MSLRRCSFFLTRLRRVPHISRCYSSHDNGHEVKKPTQILSTLFPQTSPVAAAEPQVVEQKKKEEQDEKKEQDKSWKRMKLGYDQRRRIFFVAFDLDVTNVILLLCFQILRVRSIDDCGCRLDNCRFRSTRTGC